MRASPINPGDVEINTVRGWEPIFYHLFTRDMHSGSRNCVCGGAFEHIHHPHNPVQSLNDPERCVCSKLISDHRLSG